MSCQSVGHRLASIDAILIICWRVTFHPRDPETLSCSNSIRMLPKPVIQYRDWHEVRSRRQLYFLRTSHIELHYFGWLVGFLTTWALTYRFKNKSDRCAYPASFESNFLRCWDLIHYNCRLSIKLLERSEVNQLLSAWYAFVWVSSL